MSDKQLFDKYYSRLKKEGILKAAIFGIIVGFAVNFGAALVTWFISDFNGLWLSIGVGLVAGVLTGLILYYKVFRPTTKSIARRLDSLGLEERLITMIELEKDPSYIAMRQREDAKQTLQTLDTKSIKFNIAKSTIIAAVIIGVLGLSMTTVSALTELGIIPDADVVFPRPVPPIEYISVTYDIDGGGMIEGIQEQVVEKGKNAETVIAIADDGYAFAGWSDGVESPERTDLNVQEEIIVSAQFMLIGDAMEDSDPMESDDPSQPQDPNDPGEQEPEQPSEGNSEQQDRYLPSNQIVDRETAYQDEFYRYYQEMMEYLSEHPDAFTQEEREFIERYFDILKTGVGEESDE